MRAVIRIILPDTTKEEAIALSDEIEKVVEQAEGAEVEITISAAR